MVCDVKCGCENKFDRVETFEKHLQLCPVLQDGSISDHQQKRLQTLGLKEYLNSKAKEDLNQQLKELVCLSGTMRSFGH